MYFSITIYPPYSPLQSPHGCSCPWVCFPFCLMPPPPNSAPPQLLSSCSPSMSLTLFCLLVQFVHHISHVCEITWYLSFSDWLISLSIMFSRSIYAVTNGKIFFFLGQSSSPLCKCPIVVLSTHLLMDTGCFHVYTLSLWHGTDSVRFYLTQCLEFLGNFYGIWYVNKCGENQYCLLLACRLMIPL